MTSTVQYPVDSRAMLDAAASLPEQVLAAASAAQGLENLPDHEEIEHVVVVGMGGSGIAGDVLASAAGPYLPVPVVVVKGYNIPAFVGEGSLVFVISFSGDTEETLEAATEAAVNGARLVVVTGRRGELARLADAWDAPVVNVPDDIPQPRSALGALSVPPLVVLEEIGLFPGASHWIDAAVEQLTARREELTRPGNLADDLAARIGRTIPLFHGSGLGAVAAQRWKTQVNENAKCPAFWNSQPELCHNEVAGWGQHGDVTRQVFTLVGLRHDFEHPQVMHRFQLTYELLEEVVGGIEEVQAAGDGELAQLLDLVMIGDFTSIQMARRAGVDPGPVPAIAGLKAVLARHPPEDDR